jgi:hypothetical protein
MITVTDAAQLAELTTLEIRNLHCDKNDALAAKKREYYQQTATLDDVRAIAAEIIIIRQHIEKKAYGKVRLNARQMLLSLTR